MVKRSVFLIAMDTVVRLRNSQLPGNANIYVVMATSRSNAFDSNVSAVADGEAGPVAIATNVVKAIVMTAIIAAALLGNALVIVGVYRSDKLKSSIANVFIVSLAAADFMVALMVMPFSAIQVRIHAIIRHVFYSSCSSGNPHC